ncbi:MAG TPA: xanthan lyase [Verrucomicrobiales bacterium]|nr:xanthan lyase [Verrucomicrobiales bacterium]HCN81785.1 xanthan lyase [Verrucomicrobiales bacterium]
MTSPCYNALASLIDMPRFFLPMLFSLGGGCVFSIEPHPDATPNTHAPGEVDIKANQKFIIPNPDTLPGIVLDETNAILKGKWQYSTHTPPYVGIGYLHDQKSDKGKKSATFIPDLPRSGKYEVRLSHCYNSRRSTVTPVTIVHANGKSIVRINQQDVPKHGKLFRSLGTFEFKKGKKGSVIISNEGTEGKYVIADAVQFLPKHQRR